MIPYSLHLKIIERNFRDHFFWDSVTKNQPVTGILPAGKVGVREN